MTTGVDSTSAEERMNASSIHVDLMVGSPELDVDGVTHGGEHVPVLRAGAWRV
ncbi:MAG: aminopeptidase [Thermoleophilia bacterium]|nr:aminopeptidase [Thermoleophilia bacterium]